MGNEGVKGSKGPSDRHVRYEPFPFILPATCERAEGLGAMPWRNLPRDAQGPDPGPGSPDNRPQPRAHALPCPVPAPTPAKASPVRPRAGGVLPSRFSWACEIYRAYSAARAVALRIDDEPS